MMCAVTAGPVGHPHPPMQQRRQLVWLHGRAIVKQELVSNAVAIQQLELPFLRNNHRPDNGLHAVSGPVKVRTGT